MVDRSLLARKIAAVRDATERIRSVLPESPEAFDADRSTREIVTPTSSSHCRRYEIASRDLGDLESFCGELAKRA